MRIARLEIEGFRGAPDLSIATTRGDGSARRAIWIRGASASGKTSVLAAIALAKEAIGPYGVAPRPRSALRRGCLRGRVAITWDLDAAEAEEARLVDRVVETSWSFDEGESTTSCPRGLRKLLARYELDPGRTKLELVPEDLVLREGRARRLSPNELAGARLTDDPSKYDFVPSAIAASAAASAAATSAALVSRGLLVASEEADALGDVRAALRTLRPSLRLGPLVVDGAAAHVAFDDDARGRRTFAELSRFERRAVVIASIFPLLGLARSIMLVDAPTSGASAAEGEALVRGLLEVARDGQLFVTSVDAPPPGLDVQVVEIDAGSSRAEVKHADVR